MKEKALFSTSKINYWQVAFWIEFFALFFTLLFSVFRQPSCYQLESISPRPLPTPSPVTSIKITAWKEFSDPTFNFSFHYPAEWHLAKNSSSVSVANYPDSCSHCSLAEKQRYFEFYIQDHQKTVPTNNALKYLLQEWLDFIEEEEKRCSSSNPCLPLVPGFTSEYKALASHIFVNQKASAVEVHPYFFSPASGDDRVRLVENEYLVITPSRRLYTVVLVSPGYPNPENQPDIEDNHPLMEILRSLRFH